MSTGLPQFIRICQNFSRPRVDNIEQAVKSQLDSINLKENVKPGMKIGITAGSRGIQNIVPILKTVVSYLKKLGAEPCLLAAMGSHGGGTAEGQAELLASLGITEAGVGAPVITCAVCQTVGQICSGLPVYALESALTVDGIIVVNRVKTHTSFKGEVESGLVKKMVVGLGGPKGAGQFHGLGSSDLSKMLVEMGRVLLDRLPVLGGLAIIENAYEETAQITGVAKGEILTEEPKLLTYSKSLMPALPVDNLDLLVIQEMGKNYSGTGIDTNIVGRIRIQGVPEPQTPNIKRVAVLDLSEESHGNAHGVGLADFVTEKLVNKIDRAKTYLNSLTSTFVIRSAIPMYFSTERELMGKAVFSLGGIPAEKLKIAIIPNTLYLNNMWVSQAVADELKDKDNINVLSRLTPCTFDARGNLLLRI